MSVGRKRIKRQPLPPIVHPEAEAFLLELREWCLDQEDPETMIRCLNGTLVQLKEAQVVMSGDRATRMLWLFENNHERWTQTRIAETFGLDGTRVKGYLRRAQRIRAGARQRREQEESGASTSQRLA